MKLRLVVVGRDRHDPICLAADAYLERVRRTLPIELIELREVPLRKGSNPEQVMAAEAERIAATLGAGERVVAFDRQGSTLGSEAWASRLDRARQGGAPALSFVIGGPLGLHRSVLEQADERWSLSAMTLPHRIARLVVAEQLYRACTILRGEPYHK